MSVKSITISGATGVDINDTLEAAGTQNGKPFWTAGGAGLAALTGAYAGYNGTGWYLKLYTAGTPDNTNYWSTTQDHATPDLVTSWTAHGTAGGTLAITIDRPCDPIAEASAAEPPTPCDPIAEGSASGSSFKPITITGTLTSDGSTPVVFPTLYCAVVSDGRGGWNDSGLVVTPEGIDYICVYAWGSWRLQKRDSSEPLASWFSTEDVTTPDLVQTWSAQEPATGTPVVTIERPLAIV